MVSPVTASAAVASTTTAVNTASTNGEATASPSKSKRSRKHSGDASKNTCAPYSKPASKPTTRKIKYSNWKVEPFKSALARAVEEKLTGLEPQLSVGDIIIPGGTIRDCIKSIKAEAADMGVSSLLYLKDSCRTEKTKMMTSKLDCDYIQEQITLRDLKNNGMSWGRLLGSSKQLLLHHLKIQNNTVTISGKQICCRSSRIMAPSKLPRPEQPSGAV